MKTFVILAILLSFVLLVRCDDEDEFGDDDDENSDMKCLVCRAAILEMENAIKKVDPRKKVEVSGFRLDSSGRSETRSVQYSKSETYLSELMESICEVENFAKVRQKIIQKIVVNQMLASQGGTGGFDFVPDGDMTQSLNHFCLEIFEDNEEAILKEFMADVITPNNIEDLICTKTGKYCDEDDAASNDERSEL